VLLSATIPSSVSSGVAQRLLNIFFLLIEEDIESLVKEITKELEVLNAI